MGSRLKKLGGVLFAAALLTAPTWNVAHATPEVWDYLLIARGDQSSIGTAVAVSDGELGANSSSVPMSEISGSVPALPGNAAPVYVGTGGHGDIAITDNGGNFDVSNVEVFGDTGINCEGPLGNCNHGNSNSDFNGSNLTNSNGLNANVDLSNVNSSLAALSNQTTGIPSLVGDTNITLNFSDGEWDSHLSIFLASGTTIFDFHTDENDLKLENVNLLIDGPADAYAIFRIPDDANFLVSNANMVVGNSGIGTDRVLFYTDRPDNGQHINVNNAIINGITFADLGGAGGEIHFDNVQGCTQLVGDKLNLNNVRLNRCSAFAPIPEPSVGLLLALGLGGLGLRRRTHTPLAPPSC